MNLISKTSVPQLWTRHIADSLQLLALAPPNAKAWVDIGSGGGFPGLVLACALADVPGASVHLVESSRKKASFLADAAQTLELPVKVHPVRAETFCQGFAGKVDIVTARAVAGLADLLAIVAPFLSRGAIALLPKGRDAEKELTFASDWWKIDYSLVPSLTSSDSRIVVVRGAVALTGKPARHRGRGGANSHDRH